MLLLVVLVVQPRKLTFPFPKTSVIFLYNRDSTSMNFVFNKGHQLIWTHGFKSRGQADAEGYSHGSKRDCSKLGSVPDDANIPSCSLKAQE